MENAAAPSMNVASLASGVRANYHRPRANVLGVGIDALDMNRALASIESLLVRGRTGYVCAVGVHGILESFRSEALRDAYAQSSLNLPDGTPTVWLGRLQGFRGMDHVTGPALMHEIFSREEFASRSHFFYGGKPGVAAELASVMRRRFPWTKIAGTYTPPFRDLTEPEECELIARINGLHPDMIWVGISTPRQELWIRRMLPRLDTRLMFGVGAAFDFHTGCIRQCPAWVKRAGFHWLHRLMQDPKRLWRRNLHNMAFFWHIALQLTGMREYPVECNINRGASTFDRMAAQTCSDDRQAGAGPRSRRS